MPSSDVVRASFNAYLAQDRETAAQLIAEDFVFTSPHDDHIDKTAYLERCFPAAGVSARRRSCSSSTPATTGSSSSTSTN